MKKVARILTVIILSLSIYSCSSDNETESDSSNEIFVKFTANGQEFNFVDPISIGSAGISINGQIDTGTSVTIWMPSSLSEGTFNFSGDFFEEGDYKLNVESSALEIDGWSETGSVTITSITSEYIEGTFSGNIGGKAITNGSFRAFSL